MTYAEAVEFIRQWNRQFNGGKRVSEPTVEHGISFWRVGVNASHEFYAGVSPEGRLYRLSFGEDDYDEDTGEITYKECITEVPDFDGYYGHF